MEINKEYIQRVLKTGGMESTINGNYVVLNDKTPQGWTLSLNHQEGISIDVWIEKPKPESGAWVDVSIPVPQTANDLSEYILSGCIRWAVSGILKSPGLLDVASTQPLNNG